MSWIETVDTPEPGSELEALYARVVDPVTGQLDNIMTVHSLHPAGLKAHFELYTAVMAGTAGLRKVDRELIALVVSRANDCHY